MRTLLVFFIAFVICFYSCKHKENKTETKDTVSQKVVLPEKPLGFVSDYERMFTQPEIIYLDSIIKENERQTTNQIAVVTLNFDSSYINKQEDFNLISLRLFRQWGIGLKDKNNGIGVLISPQLRMVRIEVGYGLENKLTDEEAKIIIDNILIPEFKKGNYFAGISNGLQEIFKETN